MPRTAGTRVEFSITSTSDAGRRTVSAAAVRYDQNLGVVTDVRNHLLNTFVKASALFKSIASAYGCFFLICICPFL